MGCGASRGKVALDAAILSRLMSQYCHNPLQGRVCGDLGHRVREYLLPDALQLLGRKMRIYGQDVHGPDGFRADAEIVIRLPAHGLSLGVEHVGLQGDFKTEGHGNGSLWKVRGSGKGRWLSTALETSGRPVGSLRLI